MFYSGCDLHKRNSYLATVSHEGETIKHRRIPNDKVAFMDYLSQIGKPHKLVVESTANWYWLRDFLVEQGIEFVLAHAKYLKAICYAK